MKKLKVFGDYNIIVSQIRNKIHCNSPHLKNYQWEVLKLIYTFESFNIIVILRDDNKVEDSLATTASRLAPFEYFEASRFSTKLI